MQVADSLSEDPTEEEKNPPPVLAENLAAPSVEFGTRCLELRSMLASYLRAMLPDHGAVEDCMQETFIVLWQRYSLLDGDDFRRVAFTCAKHKGHTWLTKNKVGGLLIVDPEVLRQIAEVAAGAADEVGPTESKFRVIALRQCLNGLSAEERNLIEARYAGRERESLIAIADKTGRKANALYKQLERLRTALKRCVKSKMTNQYESGS